MLADQVYERATAASYGGKEVQVLMRRQPAVL